MIMRSVPSEWVAVGFSLGRGLPNRWAFLLFSLDAQSAQIPFFPLGSMWYFIFWLCDGNALLSCRYFATQYATLTWVTYSCCAASSCDGLRPFETSLGCLPCRLDVYETGRDRVLSY